MPPKRLLSPAASKALKNKKEFKATVEAANNIPEIREALKVLAKYVFSEE